MIKTITNAGFISQKTGLSFDVILEKIEEDDLGFNIFIVKIFKDTDGKISDEVPPKRDVITIAKESKLNLYNNIISDCETKIINQLTK